MLGHARRGFADLYKISKDPRAAIAVKKIAGLYRLEKISSRPVEKIRQWRQRYARPILEKCGHGLKSRNRNVFREGHYTKPLSMRCLIA